MPQLLTVPAAPIPCIGYIRVSMAREEMISPDIQRAAITAWARRTGRKIIDWVVDPDMSGRNFRRKVMGAIERVERGEAVEIAAYRYDRWGRNALESLANIRRVEMVGGQVQSATEPVDAETAIGKYTRHNALGLAEMQSDLISENWKAAIDNRVGRLLTTNGSQRFGYLRLGKIRDPFEPRRWRRDPADPDGERYEPDYVAGTADAHVEMFDHYITGGYRGGFGSIRDWLNARGIRNTRGAIWSDVTTKNVMDSGFAAGLLRLHNPECRCRNATTCKNKVLKPGAHDAIIEADVWQTFLRVRADRGRRPPRARYASYPLTSLILCGHCNSAMTTQSGTGQAGYGYRCKRWHHYRDCPSAFPRRAAVEEVVRGELQGWSADIGAAAAVTPVRTPARISADVDRDRLTRALADADAALTRLLVQRATDVTMPDHVYETARAQLLAARAVTETELAAVSHEPAVTVTRAERLPIIRGVLDQWETLPPDRIRDMLAQVIRHAQVWRTEVPTAPRIVVTPLWEPCECRHCEEAAAA